MAYELGAALINGASSLLGGALSGIFGNSAQQDANRMNLQISRENNKFNADQAQLNREFQERMYNANNAYNTMKEQRKRWEEAGFNPYFMLPNAQSSQLQSAPSGASASSSGNPVMHAYDPTAAISDAAQGVGNAVAGYFSNRKLSADTEAQAIDNITRYRKNIAEIDKIIQDKNTSKEQQAKLKAEKDRIMKLMDKEYELLSSEVEISKSNQVVVGNQVELQNLEKEGQGLSNAFQAWYNEFSKKKGKKELDQLQKIIALTEAQTAAQYAQKVLAEAQEQGINLDNNQKRELNPLLIKAQQLANEHQRLENLYGNNPYTAGGRFIDQLSRKFKTRSTRRFLNKLVGAPQYDSVIDYNGNVRW